MSSPTLRNPGWRRAGIIAAVLYLLVLHGFVLVLVVKTNFLTLAGKTLGLLPPEEWTSEFATQTLDLAAHDRAVPPGAVLLLGDSIMAEVPPGLVDGRAENLAIPGETLHMLSRRLPVLRSLEQARAIVLGIGVNYLKYRPAPTSAADYAALLIRLPGGVPVLMLSVLPVDETADVVVRRWYLRNATIRDLNARLRTVCTAYPACTFVDAWPALADPASGGLRAELHGGDGWHLSVGGARALAAVLANEGRPGLRPGPARGREAP